MGKNVFWPRQRKNNFLVSLHFKLLKKGNNAFTHVQASKIKKNIEIDNYLNSEVRHGDSLVRNLEEYLMSKR